MLPETFDINDRRDALGAMLRALERGGRCDTSRKRSHDSQGASKLSLAGYRSLIGATMRGSASR